jgi:phosphonate transport system ATP-binding protein
MDCHLSVTFLVYAKRSAINSAARNMADKGPLLVTDAITKVFGQARAVDNVSLGIPAGQFVGVIGRSGAGKSTLLRLINRLTDPSTGRVLCGEIEVTALRGRNLRVWRRRCAMIF